MMSWRSVVVVIVTVATSIARAETWVSGYLGYAWTRDSDLHVDQPATDSNASFGGVQWDSKSFEAPPYYGVRLTHFPEAYPSWGVALDFTHYKVYARTADSVAVSGRWNGAPVDTTAPLGERVQSFSISHGVNYVGPLVLYRWSFDASPPYRQGRVQPYVGVGPIYYIDHPENTVNGFTTERYQGSGWGWQAVAGARYLFTERWSVFGEIKHDEGTAKVSVGGDGSANTRLRTTHAVFGVGYSF